MPKVKDPHCGITVDSESAEASLDVQGSIYYFCSTRCRQAFEAQSARYVDDGARAATNEGRQLEQHEPPFTITGLLTSPKFGAAGSGGLEYELLPEAHGRSRE